MQKQIFVLVHGAFHGGWCWREVADRLVARGHRVFTPTLTGLGERTHLLRDGLGWSDFVEDILNVLRYEEIDDVVLVGHSFSGGTIAGAADQMPERLKHLVFFDAMILEDGQSPTDTAPAELIQTYRERAQASSGGVSLPPNDPSYYGITDPVQAAKLTRLMTPHPFSTYFDKLRLVYPLCNGVPATYVACTAPMLPATAKARAYAKAREHWSYVELDAPHNAMMTVPGDVADLLERCSVRDGAGNRL